MSDLSDRADTVVEVTIDGSQAGKLYFAFEGNNPETNPFSADPDDGQPVAEESAMDALLVQATVEEVFNGELRQGLSIEVAQLLGDTAIEYLEDDKTYILLLTAGDGPTGIVGGNQGQFTLQQGRYQSVDSNTEFDLKRDQLEFMRKDSWLAAQKGRLLR